jgi:hypothetical protein
MNKFSNIIFPVLIVSALIFPVLTVSAQEAKINVSGLWDTDWEPLTLKQSGNKIEGEYPEMDNGEVFGTIDGNVFDGFWIEDMANERCSEPLRGRYYWGKFKMVFEGEKFKAKWGYCHDGTLTRSWTGTLVKSEEEIILKDIPPDAKVTKIHFIRKVESDFDEIKEISYGEPFYIKAVFDSPPEEDKKTVTLDWGEGTGKKIIVKKQDDNPKIFLSDIIYVKRPDSPEENN